MECAESSDSNGQSSDTQPLPPQSSGASAAGRKRRRGESLNDEALKMTGGGILRYLIRPATGAGSEVADGQTQATTLPLPGLKATNGVAPTELDAGEHAGALPAEPEDSFPSPTQMWGRSPSPPRRLPSSQAIKGRNLLNAPRTATTQRQEDTGRFDDDPIEDDDHPVSLGADASKSSKQGIAGRQPSPVPFAFHRLDSLASEGSQLPSPTQLWGRPSPAMVFSQQNTARSPTRALKRDRSISPTLPYRPASPPAMRAIVAGGR
mmetsp:Transcript_44257/g.102225  ORF Transcript_44257/g.102225 Transcript_44257/m.102225 type:complete len:264 (+) Transcript_44257:41-832(+)